MLPSSHSPVVPIDRAVLAMRKIELQDKVTAASLAPGVKAQDILARLKNIFRVRE